MADDHTMFREGLAGLLASYGGLEVVAEVPNDEEAVEIARHHKPDVVIMQVQVPFERSTKALEQIRRITPQPKVIIVTMFEDPHTIRELLKMGVSAYVLKSVSSRHLIGAVRAAVFDPQAENVVVGMPRQAIEEASEGTGGVLTARQLEILLLASRGMSNHQIATSVHLAEGTVKRHLADAYKKMNVGSRSEAAKKALREEWITISDVTQEDEDLEDEESDEEGEEGSG
ncbi:MAG: response regulator transcription factor [Rubrobacteraceae bacterium]